MAAGRKTGGGSRKGVPNKATKELKDMIRGALDSKGGQKWLIEQMDKNPVAFMTLLGKILPNELSGKGGGPIETISKILIVGIDPEGNEVE